MEVDVMTKMQDKVRCLFVTQLKIYFEFWLPMRVGENPVVKVNDIEIVALNKQTT